MGGISPMTWNYRVVRRIDGRGEEFLAIYEVYYDKEGNPEAVTEDPISPHGDDMDDLHGAFDLYKLSLDKPVLNYEDF